jgi:macrolide transport system ATP-binding/permease protein
MRSILSVLGVTIGVASLITMLAIGTGARKSIEDQMKQLGFNDNILMVWPDVAEKNGVYINGGMAVEFDVEDISRIKRSVSGIESVAGHLSDFVQIVAGSKNYNTKLLGASVEAADLEKLSPSIGRFFTKAEDMEQKKLALLGKTVVKKIYGSEDFNPIGQYVKINRMSFQVIGVLPVRKASRSYSDYDDLVVVPLSTAMHKLFGVKHLDDMIMRVKDGADIKETADAVRKKLLFFHRMSSSKKEVVKCWDSKELQKSVASQSRSFSFLLGSIAFISLLVGGIGIMNIMFVSVSERIKEIGLRKALGANNADILFQFIIESVFVCCVGGIIGILFGSGSSVVISKFARWTTSITSFSIWLSFCFSCFIGLIFGIWPARKASLLNPIDALRHN